MVFALARRMMTMTEPAAAAVPRGVRIYAVGDVHGRLDLLDRLLDRIAADGRDAGDLIKHIVFLGDYIDRGPCSAGVIERLIAGPPAGFGAIHLKGNHEAALLDTLVTPRAAAAWMAFGGVATLASYGIAVSMGGVALSELDALRDRLRAALPPHHLRFFRSLRTSVSVGDYLFVHAGVRPGVPLERQTEKDMIWIREPFLHSDADFGKVVVHGHTIALEPEVRRNRIGIDTGAYATHRLTALVLEGTQRRFLSTG